MKKLIIAFVFLSTLLKAQPIPFSSLPTAAGSGSFVTTLVSGRMTFTPTIPVSKITGISATSPLFYNNSTGVFTVQPSSTSQSGVVTSTDWNLFNEKQSALVSGTNIKTVNGSTLLGSGNLSVGDLLSTGSYTNPSWISSLPLSKITGTNVLQPALNGTGLVTATGTVISYDNSAYLTAATIPSSVVTTTGTQTLTNKSGNISQWTNNSNYLTANQTITVTGIGDVTGSASGTTSITPTWSLATVNNNTGTIGSAANTLSVTLDAKGRATSAGTIAISGLPESATTGLVTDLSLKENLSNKDASGGYVGSTLFKINFRNVANTFTSFLTNSNTAARTYTYGDASGFVVTTGSQLTSAGFIPFSSSAASQLTFSSGLTFDTNTLLVGGNLRLANAGNGLYIKTGTNATFGLATLVGGTVVVNTTKTTANSVIILTGQGGTITNLGTYNITARVVGTSFTITSSNVLDTNTVGWIIIEPAP